MFFEKIKVLYGVRHSKLTLYLCVKNGVKACCAIPLNINIEIKSIFLPIFCISCQRAT
jgi:hypothetical protein